MMKASRIAAAINSQDSIFQLRACLFHCTPVSERRRRTDWDPAISFRGSPKKYNRYSRRLMKKTMLRDVNEFAERLFKSWNRDEDDQPSGKKNSWFRPNFRDSGYGRGKSRNRASQGFRKHFEFCEDDNDDADFHNIFHSMFGGNRSFYWSFTRDDEPRFWSSSSYSSNYWTSGGRKYQFDEESEEYTSSAPEYEKPAADELRSDRLTLGLAPSGPLKIEDVKNAYRACALKWHPDRHQGSSKAVAEEKFKICSAAYESVCNKLPLH